MAAVKKWFAITSIWPILILILSTHKCYSATHWIVTENGRIEQQANSLFNLQKPFDLVSFIQQEQKLNQVNLLQKELKCQQDILAEVNRQEKIDLSETFFKKDPLCSRLSKRWHELDQSLNYILPFSSKGLNLAHHINFESPVKTHNVKTPLCLINLPFSLHTYDHLAGVANRHKMIGVSEYNLLSKMPYITDVGDWGDRIAMSLTKNSSSWILQNLAAIYWRVQGNTIQSINCLREALHFSPREHKDVALLGLAQVLHNSNHSLDSVILLHASLELTSDIALHQFILGTIYASLELFEMAEHCFRFVTQVQPGYVPARERLEAVICEQRYIEALNEQYSSLEQVLSKVNNYREKHKTLQKLKVSINNLKQLFPYEQFKKQLDWLNKNHLLCAKSWPLGSNQERVILGTANLDNNDKNNLEQEIISAINTNKVDASKPFTVNIQVDQKKLMSPDSNPIHPCNSQVEFDQNVLSSEEKSKRENTIKKNEKKNQEKENMKTIKHKEVKNAKEAHQNEVNSKSRTDQTSRTGQTSKASQTSKAGKTGKTDQTSKTGQSSKTGQTSIKDKAGHTNQVSKASSTKPLKNVVGQNNDGSSALDKQNTKRSSTRSKRETEKRIKSNVNMRPLTLEEKTEEQIQHTRATLARVKNLLKIPHGKGSLRGAKSTAGPGGTGQGPLRDSGKASRKGESRRSVTESAKPAIRTSAPLKYHQNDEWRGLTWKRIQSCANPTKNGKKRRKGDFLVKGCEQQTNDIAQLSSQSNAPVQSTTKEEPLQKSVNLPASSQPTLAKSKPTVSKSRERSEKNILKETPTNNEQIKNGNTNSQNTHQENKTHKEHSGTAGVLPGIKMQDALLSNKNFKSRSDFDYRSCKDEENYMEKLKAQNNKFSAVVSLASKGFDVSKYIDLKEDISGLPMPPRCVATIKPGLHSYDHLKGVLQIGKSKLQPESGLIQTLLSRKMSVEDMGTRIHRALKKNPNCWVLLNLASLYWRIEGNAYETVRCLRLSLLNPPNKSALEIPLISLASILFRGRYLDDAATISRDVLKISPNSAVGHFALANTLAAQGVITEATQHFLIVLQLEPGFVPAVECLKIIQCILWKQQKELEKEAEDLRKLLSTT